MSEKKKPDSKVIYRDKKLVADRPGHSIVQILAKHTLPYSEDFNPAGETAGAAAAASLEYAGKVEAGKKKGGKAKRGRYGPMRAVINHLQPASLESLLSMLENEDMAGDLPENRTLLAQGLRIKIHEIDRGSEKVYYSVNGTEGEASFKTLRNHISSRRALSR